MLTRRRFLLGTSFGLGSLAIPRIVRAQAVPDSLLARPSGSIPQGIPQLDPNDPINVGIVDNWVFSPSGLPINVKNLDATATIHGAGGGLAPLGRGGYGTGGNYFHLPLTAIAASSTIPWTIRLLGYPVSWPANFSAFIDSPSRSVALFCSTAGVRDFGSVMSSAPNTNFTLPAGKIFDLIVSANVGASFSTNWYLNGRFFCAGSNWTTNIPITEVDLGANVSGGGTNPNCIYYLFQTWNRNLLLGEIAKFDTQPFAGLIFPSDRLPLWGVTGVPSFINRPLVRPIFTLPGG